MQNSTFLRRQSDHTADRQTRIDGPAALWQTIADRTELRDIGSRFGSVPLVEWTDVMAGSGPTRRFPRASPADPRLPATQKPQRYATSRDSDGRACRFGAEATDVKLQGAGRGFPGFGMRGCGRVLILSGVSIVAILSANAAFAGCVEVDSDHWKCTGSLTEIQAYSSTSLPPNVHSLLVEALTANIVDGIDYYSLGQDSYSLELTLETGDFQVKRFVSIETTGFDGDHRTNKAGGQAAPGGPVTLYLSGTVSSDGTGNVSLKSSAGKGGSGSSNDTGEGHAGGAANYGGPVQFNLIGPATLDGLGVFLSSNGGVGGTGGSSDVSYGGNGGNGFAGGPVQTYLPNPVDVLKITNSGIGVTMRSAGGAGGTGGEANAGDAYHGGNGGNGGAGGALLPDLAANGTSISTGSYDIQTTLDNTPGMLLSTLGGVGGTGGGSNLWTGGAGGKGGNGGQIYGRNAPSVERAIQTQGMNAPGIRALSAGGVGGEGANGGAGGSGGAGNYVDFESHFEIKTHGSESDGVVAVSIGGSGGSGGGTHNHNDGGGDAGVGGRIFLSSSGNGSIETFGTDSSGLVGQSIGGRGGAGTTTSSLFGAVEFGANGGSGGNASEVQVINTASGGGIITTQGDLSSGIVAQSIGGGGGHGGNAMGAFYAKGGSGSYGGAADEVIVQNGAMGTITTTGHDAHGILAQSIGGTGGTGGSAVSLAAFGGNAAIGSNGDTVEVINAGQIRTGYQSTSPSSSAPDAVCGVGCSHGIAAQSIGGGGGNGGSSAGWFSVGAAGGGGGDGNQVTVQNTGDISTTLVDSNAIMAQSIGGGGGRGGSSGSIGLLASAAIGGSGGQGGTGGAVNVNTLGNLTASNIHTSSDRSHGIFAQSIGGGGGQGGFAVSASFGPDTPAVDLALGGTGGPGGGSSAVHANALGSITTLGKDAAGLLSQSVGGGGGNGGFAVSLAASTDGSLAFGLGGGGGVAGHGNDSVVVSDAVIHTSGDRSPGILSQSVGGGGGHGGLSVAVAGGTGSANIGLSMGGGGGAGGEGYLSHVTSNASVTTKGADSPGVVSQSIGGGGGSGGLAVSGVISLEDSTNLAGALGGTGKAGGNSGGAGNPATYAQVQTTDTVTTSGDRSHGVLVQSIGGGGGHGGTAISASLSAEGGNNFDVAVGGSGGSGGFGNRVGVDIQDDITTSGYHSAGLLAQSVGGSGGTGGSGISGSITLDGDSNSLNVALGGVGGKGSYGGTIVGVGSQAATVSGNVTTTGIQSDGILLQSVGGGGGNGGYAISGTISMSKSNSLGVSLGGGAGSGGYSDTVALDLTGDVTAIGSGSRGVVVQSIGGGGGNGGMAVTGNFTTSSSSKAVEVSIGGKAGNGGAASTVSVINTGRIQTGAVSASAFDDTDPTEQRENEHGLVAHSIGGGGGTGGYAANGTASTSNKGTQSLKVGVGGAGGSGATSSAVAVSHSGSIGTVNALSHGILAQSVAGGGGAGGSTTTFDAIPQTDDDAKKSATVTVGGSGGGGAASSSVSIAQSGEITVKGLGARGIVAQSIAGGGGIGGGSSFKSYSGGKTKDSTTSSLTVGIGGSGGTASHADDVTLTTPSAGTITTGSNRQFSDTIFAPARYSGHGILLQSVGGGGGDGGAGLQGDVTPTGGKTGVAVGLGGTAGGGGNGGNVTAGTMTTALTGSVTTTDYGSFGLLAQSVGGGGGTGGTGIAGDVNNGSSKGLTFGLGMSGGNASAGKTVSIHSDMDIKTHGDGSKGLVAQSIGGGGGSGGTGIKGNVGGGNEDGSKQIAFGLGLTGGSGGDGGTVSLSNTNTITTGISATGSAMARGAGYFSGDAIMAQSVGGGGGSGGTGMTGNITNSSKGTAKSLNLGVGLGGGGGGGGMAVSVVNAGQLTANGTGSRGIFAQSVGGGGGDGGMGLEGNITAPSDTESDKQLDIGIGGQGGSGGAGGTVYVKNGAAISTQAGSSADVQGQMHGILAQSIGGGGGNGAIGINGDITGSKTSKALNVAVGGSGGSGGKGAQGALTDVVSDAGVGIANTHQITVLGDNSVGIFAQNIGGGGGSGAAGLGGTVDSGDGKAVTFSLGGSGGNGNDGGTINVQNSGAITTGSKDTVGSAILSQAHGMFLQSVGGGGGNGQMTGSLLYGSTSSGAEKGVAFTVGGTAGGGDGGDIKAVNAAGITTYNAVSHGLFGQSVGGGGGAAGDLGGIGTDDASNKWQAAIAIGGGGGAGNGGEVTLDHQQGTVIETYGVGAFGIYAQSIGGGGGVGGDGAGAANSDDATQTTKNANVAINVGGQNGSTGDGDDVTVTVDGDVTTGGLGATAIMAQSIGGGGGIGGAGVNGLSGSVTLGGSGGASGDGAGVSVTGGGQVTTGGAADIRVAAHGIVAQSVGGGGGYAGSFVSAGAMFSGDPDMSLDDDTSGNGGSVEVDFNGPLQTTGGSSYGILAQSIGGGGGVAGSAEATPDAARLGSSGGTGVAGPVMVTATGKIATRGDFAHAIVAQAAGGSDTGSTAGGNDVHVTLTGSMVSADGNGAAGIVAQNTGAGAGAFYISIDESSSVTGGAGTDTGSLGTNAAVILADGTSDNRLDLSGTLTSANGAAGIAVKYDGSAKVTINNSGHMIGTVVGNPSAFADGGEAVGIDVKNNAGGVLEMGGSSRFDSLINLGSLEVGGVELFDTLTSYGDIQTGNGGTLNFELGGTSTYDRISTYGGLAFGEGSAIGIDIFGDLRPETDLIFDIAIAETLSFASTDLFSFLDFSGAFPESSWSVSIVKNMFDYGGPFDLAGFESPEVLRLTYVHQPAPVPLPATLWIYLTGVGALWLRRARR